MKKAIRRPVVLLLVVMTCVAALSLLDRAGERWLNGTLFRVDLAAQQAPAQPPQTPPSEQQPAVTFRAETNFVEVHAIVTDQKGAFVKDLTQADFEVYEDGRLQAPTVFSMVDMPLEKPFIPLNATVPIEPDVRATTRTFDGRIYILLLDDLHTNVTRTNNVREVEIGRASCRERE